MVDDLLDRAEFMMLPPGEACLVGAPGSALEQTLARRDIRVTVRAPASFDEEQPWTATGFDYIFSCQTLGTLNDLPGALLHYRNALNEGGLFIGQMTGAGSLPALRQIMLAADGDRPAARLHPQVDTGSATALLQRAGYSRQVVDSRTLTVRFASFDTMIADLRQQGLTSVLLSRPPHVGKAGLSRALAAFEALRDVEGRVSERFEILTLTGWK